MYDVLTSSYSYDYVYILSNLFIASYDLITKTSTAHFLYISLSPHYVIMHVYDLFLIVDYSQVQPQVHSPT